MILPANMYRMRDELPPNPQAADFPLDTGSRAQLEAAHQVNYAFKYELI